MLSFKRLCILDFVNLSVALFSHFKFLHVSALLFSFVFRFVHQDFLAVARGDALVDILGIVGDPRADVTLPLSEFIFGLLNAFDLFQVDEFDLFGLVVQNLVQVLLPDFDAGLPHVGVVYLLRH